MATIFNYQAAPGWLSKSWPLVNIKFYVLIISCIFLTFTFTSNLWAKENQPKVVWKESETMQLDLLGIYVAGNEIAVLQTIKFKDYYWLPLQELALAIKSEVVTENNAVELLTPLGGVIIEPQYLQQYQNEWYVNSQALKKQFASSFAYSQNLHALNLELPWSLSAAEKSAAEKAAIEPDAYPPSYGLSSIQVDYDAFYRDGDVRSLVETDLRGRVAGGYWRFDYLYDFEGDDYIDELSWFRRFDNQVLGLGTQRYLINPLLREMDFTGAQYAYTNRDLDAFSGGNGDNVFSRWIMSPIRDIQGQGTPGGIAELRINDRVVERISINLDGNYVFENITLLNQQYNRIQVYIYDRRNSPTPSDIQDFSQTGSDAFMEKGTFLHLVGIGQNGNAFDSRFDDILSDDTVGYYHGRYGVTDRLTLEAAYQQNAFLQGQDEDGVFLTGAAIRILENWVGSFNVASAGSGNGYRVELQGYGEKWRFNSQSQWTDDDFDVGFNAGEKNLFAEYTYLVRYGLEVGLIGRVREYNDNNFQEDVDYILPTVYWRPNNKFYVRARPDNEGDYRVDSRYQFNRKTWLDYTFDEQQHNSTLNYRMRNNLDFSLGASISRKDEFVDRYEATVNWYSLRFRDSSIQAGVSSTDSKFGYFVRAFKKLLPGLRAQLEIIDEPSTISSSTNNDLIALLSLTADYSFTGKRFLPSESSQVRYDRGGIAGRITIRGAENLPTYSLAEVGVIIDGRPMPGSGRDGSFFVGNLTPGTYLVELDYEKLPIELVPETNSYWVRVESSAVTEINFWVKPEFGIAGRVTSITGEKLANVTLLVMNANGEELQKVQTDQYGLYRADQLAPGQYQVKAIAINGEVLPSNQQATITIDIVDDYLFGQNLVLPD